MTLAQTKTIALKAYCIKDLSQIYNVDRKTFKKWVEPFEKEIGKPNGRYYNIPQVKMIFAKLGLPGFVIIEE